MLVVLDDESATGAKLGKYQSNADQPALLMKLRDHERDLEYVKPKNYCSFPSLVGKILLWVFGQGNLK